MRRTPNVWAPNCAVLEPADFAVLPDDEEAGVAGVATDGPNEAEGWLAETADPITEEAPEAP